MRLSDLRPGARRRRRIIEALWDRRGAFGSDPTLTRGQQLWAMEQVDSRLFYAGCGRDRFRLPDDWVPTREQAMEGYFDLRPSLYDAT